MGSNNYSVSKSREDGTISISTKAILRFSQVKSVIALLDVEWETINSHIKGLFKEKPWQQNCAWACVGVAGSAAVALIPNMILNALPNENIELDGDLTSNALINAYQMYRLSNSILILVFVVALVIAAILFYKSLKEKSLNDVTVGILQDEIEAINKRLTEQNPITTTSENGSTEPDRVVMTLDSSNDTSVTTD